MKFKKLSLIGFKSFANKLEIKFGEGITAIVGPNGCGKSNVVDAVRWVLGEQSAKLLRGDKMMDVIFNGTDKRKAQSYAEVALTFDNTGRVLFPSYEYEEVVIARKLFRSGVSEYYRNGSLCKLRDITDMIRDAGFALEGYTIIGQSRATELIHSKPEDRRAIFEEAAGISKYKHKKIEAERKNARTRDNLNRLNDLLYSLKDQLGPLSKAAERTRQHRELSEQLKHHEINIYINRFETASERKDALSAVIADFDGKINEKTRIIETATREYNEAMAEYQSIDQKLRDLNNELVSLSVGQTDLMGKINALQVRYELIDGSLTKQTAEREAAEKNLVQLQQTETELKNEFQTKHDELIAERDLNSALNAKYKEVSENISAEEGKLNAARNAIIAAIERRAAVNRSVGELSAERSALTEQIDKIKSGLGEKTVLRDKLCETVSVKTAELASLDAERRDLITRGENAERDSLDCAKRISEYNEELTEAKRALSTLCERAKINNEVAKNAYSYAVKQLTSAAERDLRVNAAIVGVVGRIISVKEGFETAIETVLGPAVNNIVTKDEDDASFLIDYLKKTDGGRATFLPLTSFKPHSIDPAYLPMLKREGCFGVAPDVITYEKKFEPIVRGLLGGTVVVDNKHTAISLARDAKFAFRVVTLDGDIVAPQGSISGGSKRLSTANVFAQVRQQKELTSQIHDAEKEVDRLKVEFDEACRQRDELAVFIRENSQDIRDYEVTIASRTAENTAYSNEIKKLSDEISADGFVVERLEEKLANTVADLVAVEQSDDISAEKRDDDVKRLNDELTALREQNEQMRQTVEQSNVALVKLEASVGAIEERLSRVRSEIVETNRAIEINEMSALSSRQELSSISDRIQKMSQQTTGENSRRCEEIRAALDGFSDHREELVKKYSACDELRNKANDEIADLREQKFGKEVELNAVDINMGHMQETIFKKYNLDYNACLPFKEENYDPEAGEIAAQKLDRRMQFLGGINPDAIEQAQELSQKVEDLEKQVDDMHKSLRDEQKVIDEMSSNMLRDFTDTFEKVRVNFRDTFKTLFGGGTADLQLTENEDPLLRGVEIIAQPPDKRLQSISLLSGGEMTLTAIAIIFAIMKLRPMPFCFLDELEAALDEANVTRVAAMIKEFSATTQFIVITHRKPTMEQADCLYGVTMEEKGVSTIVSVRLNDAITNAVTIEKPQGE